MTEEKKKVLLRMEQKRRKRGPERKGFRERLPVSKHAGSVAGFVSLCFSWNRGEGARGKKGCMGRASGKSGVKRFQNVRDFEKAGMTLKGRFSRAAAACFSWNRT